MANRLFNIRVSACNALQTGCNVRAANRVRSAFTAAQNVCIFPDVRRDEPLISFPNDIEPPIQFQESGLHVDWIDHDDNCECKAPALAVMLEEPTTTA